MTSGPTAIDAGISIYKQSALSALTYEITARQNERRIAKELSAHNEASFFIAPNGMIIPSKYRGWIGNNQREKLISSASNPVLKNAISSLYRKNAVIGDGGTAAVIRFEKATGLGLGRNGKTHIRKGREMLRYLRKRVLKENLSSRDRLIAEHLIRNLEKEIEN